MSAKTGRPKPKKKPAGDYDIGYCKPPPGAKWQPGKSANPCGRPKRKPSPHELYMKQAMKLVPVNVAGKQEMMSMLEVIFLSLLKKGSGGDVKAIKLAYEYGVAAHAAVTQSGAEEKKKAEPFSWTEEQEELFQQLQAGSGPDEKTKSG